MAWAPWVVSRSYGTALAATFAPGDLDEVADIGTLIRLAI